MIERNMHQDVLSTHNLTLAYPDGDKLVTAVNAVNITFPETGFFGIIGPSGSGKTSLLYLLAGIRYPSSGEIFYHGKALPNSVKERNILRRQEMGFVFQYHFLINYLTVEQNILVGAPQANSSNRQFVQQVMNTLGLQGLGKRKPYELSGGQRQRVAIARALANRPKIVFVDEPTASLDHTAGAKVVALLQDIAKDACVIVVTHDDSNLEQATQVFTMRDGVIQM